MNYKEKIIEIVNTIEHESVLQFFYSLLRVATSEDNSENKIDKIIHLLGCE